MWTDSGRRKHLGRVFHKKVRARRLSDDLVRTYKIGDTVVMKGENDDTWTAQIVELFEVSEDDEELREVLQLDLRKMNSARGYELMRVTLRWFYNPSDMNMHTIRSSSCPNHIKHEIYFSDHVEKEGYNDITVIEGKAWLVSSKRQREEFLHNPAEGYERDMDQVRVVRCFVNSLSPELAVRELDTGELEHLLRNPTAEKDLFETSRQRMRGLVHSNGTIIRPPSKGTGAKQPRRKRSRAIRKAIEIEDDEFTLDEIMDTTDLSEPVNKTQMPSASSEKRDEKERRPRRVINIDDENGEDKIVPASDPVRMQALQQANEEVLDLVVSLNQNLLSETKLASVERGSLSTTGKNAEQRRLKRVAPDETNGTQKVSKRIRTEEKAVVTAGGKKVKESSQSKARPKPSSTDQRVTSEKQGGVTLVKDWWEETQQTLRKFKKEFKSMSSGSQELFRSHGEIAFDLAVKKVSERRLFGRIDTKNEQLSEISREILNDLKKVMIGEARDGKNGLRELNDGTVVIDPSN